MRCSIHLTLVPLVLLSILCLGIVQAEEEKVTSEFNYAGQILDEKAQPIEGVTVTVIYRRTGSYGYIDSGSTNAQGRFAFKRSKAISGAGPEDVDVRDSIIELICEHPSYVTGSIADLGILSKNLQANLNLVLKAGHSLDGQVIDHTGRPVAKATVRMDYPDPDKWNSGKQVITDDQGHYHLKGLLSDGATMRVLQFETPQAVHSTRIEIESKQLDKKLDVRLDFYSMPATTVIHEVLGMRLAVIDQPMRNALLLLDTHADIVVIDPGKESVRLQLAGIAAGDIIWYIGDTSVKTVDELKAAIVRSAVADKEKQGEYLCRFVYQYSQKQKGGTMTWHMRLKERDLEALRVQTKTK